MRLMTMSAHPQFPNLYVVDHPLVRHKLSRMRDASCPTGEFRRLLKEVSFLVGYEVTRAIPTRTVRIKTPMCDMDAPVLDGPLPVVVPVLRAGLGMTEGLVELIPDCAIGHIGLYRDEETQRPVEYLVRLPKPEGNLFIITDPMLATGHSAAYAVDVIKRHHNGRPASVSLMCLVSAPEGVRVMAERHPDVRVFTAALDERLDEKAYIIPGLGDAGDRLFGTY